MDDFPETPFPDTLASLPVPDFMVFAAGLGTRMRPITFERPKALVEVAGKALIDHVFDCALAEGATRFVVNTHHQAGLLHSHIERLASALPDLSFATSHEKDRLLDTGGGLRFALDKLTSDPVLTMNCDSFWLPGTDRPISRLLTRFAQGDADAVLLCVSPDAATGLNKGADYLLDGDGSLGGRIGRPVVYAGTAVMSRDFAAGGPQGAFSLARSFEDAARAGRLKGVMIEAPWYHVGDPGALERTAKAIGALA